MIVRHLISSLLLRSVCCDLAFLGNVRLLTNCGRSGDRVNWQPIRNSDVDRGGDWSNCEQYFSVLHFDCRRAFAVYGLDASKQLFKYAQMRLLERNLLFLKIERLIRTNVEQKANERGSNGERKRPPLFVSRCGALLNIKTRVDAYFRKPSAKANHCRGMQRFADVTSG
ncbi:hypothetical protein AVEN_132270-1 [Araneus ventricosus]|uniref:Secreted protein n=1 Tax=Araneus ventricosus TaxID=182803 RepID=A0A4Y2PZX7_ARAVE|nr:hypothetical protein AVEN_132270-1 [Araneus ventricosus]